MAYQSSGIKEKATEASGWKKFLGVVTGALVTGLTTGVGSVIGSAVAPGAGTAIGAKVGAGVGASLGTGASSSIYNAIAPTKVEPAKTSSLDSTRPTPYQPIPMTNYAQTSDSDTAVPWWKNTRQGAV